MLATSEGSYDEPGKTTIYDLKSKTKIHEWDHKDWVRSVCFSPDGSMLATGDDKKKTTIYDLKSKTKIHEWDHKDCVKSVCFSPDGSMLATGDDPHDIRYFTNQSVLICGFGMAFKLLVRGQGLFDNILRSNRYII